MQGRKQPHVEEKKDGISRSGQFEEKLQVFHLTDEQKDACRRGTKFWESSGRFDKNIPLMQFKPPKDSASWDRTSYIEWYEGALRQSLQLKLNVDIILEQSYFSHIIRTCCKICDNLENKLKPNIGIERDDLFTVLIPTEQGKHTGYDGPGRNMDLEYISFLAQFVPNAQVMQVVRRINQTPLMQMKGCLIHYEIGVNISWKKQNPNDKKINIEIKFGFLDKDQQQLKKIKFHTGEHCERDVILNLHFYVSDAHLVKSQIFEECKTTSDLQKAIINRLSDFQNSFFNGEQSAIVDLNPLACKRQCALSKFSHQLLKRAPQHGGNIMYYFMPNAGIGCNLPPPILPLPVAQVEQKDIEKQLPTHAYIILYSSSKKTAIVGKEDVIHLKALCDLRRCLRQHKCDEQFRDIFSRINKKQPIIDIENHGEIISHGPWHGKNLGGIFLIGRSALPGGKIQESEPAEIAAIRELKEEFAIPLQPEILQKYLLPKLQEIWRNKLPDSSRYEIFYAINLDSLDLAIKQMLMPKAINSYIQQHLLTQQQKWERGRYTEAEFALEKCGVYVVTHEELLNCLNSMDEEDEEYNRAEITFFCERFYAELEKKFGNIPSFFPKPEIISALTEHLFAFQQQRQSSAPEAAHRFHEQQKQQQLPISQNPNAFYTDQAAVLPSMMMMATEGGEEAGAKDIQELVEYFVLKF